MAKASTLCQIDGCLRQATHQPTLLVWPLGTPSNLTTRCVHVKLRTGSGVCKRCAEKVRPDDVLNELVRAEVRNAVRLRYNAAPDMESIKVVMRRI